MSKKNRNRGNTNPETENAIQKKAEQARSKLAAFRENHPRVSKALTFTGAGLALFASYAFGYNAGSKSVGMIPEGATIIDVDEEAGNGETES